MTRHYSEFGFDDPENAKRYAGGTPSDFVPGFSVMQALAAQMIAETTPRDGHVLVLGAGGGLELSMFADTQPEWRFTAVDPSPEMIAAGSENVSAHADRIDWVEAYIPDAPEGPFDAATCLLTLHLIADNGEKLSTLKAVHRRLKRGGALVVVDNCFDKASAAFPRQMDRFIEHARRNGVEEDLLEMVRASNTEKVETISPMREESLFAEAGFSDIDLFYAGLTWRGWVMRA